MSYESGVQYKDTRSDIGTHMDNKEKRGIFEIMEPYLYLLPCFALLVAFTFYPFAKTIYLSLHTTNPQGQVSFFVGFENYINLFKSPSFRNSFIVTLKFVVLVIVPSLFIGFINAILANAKLKGNRIFKTIYALPMAVSSASAASIWMLLMHPSIGIINYVLNTDIGWLIDGDWALISVSIVTIWLNLGINFIFIIAALQGIPQELYESAAIDGAGAFRRHISITIPSIMHTLFFLLVINIINTFQSFGQINIMTRGGPAEATNVLVYGIYREAFFNDRFGVASAQSIILFVILLVLTLIQFRWERNVDYQ